MKSDWEFAEIITPLRKRYSRNIRGYLVLEQNCVTGEYRKREIQPEKVND